MSNFTLKGKLKAWRKSLAMNGVPWLKEDADAYSQLIRLANHDLGLFEVCEWWIKKYPPDIFVESPEEIVKIRKQMQIMLKARDDFVR